MYKRESLDGADQCKQIRTVNRTRSRDEAVAWLVSIRTKRCELPAGALTGPLLCELAIARQDPLEPAVIDKLVDETVGPSLSQHGALEFETLTGEFEKQPHQFVGPLQEFPALAPVRYLLVTHWATNDDLQGWLKADAVKHLSAYGEISTTISVPIKHDAGERKYLRPDGLQRDAVH